MKLFNLFKREPRIEVTSKDIVFIGGSPKDNLSPETDYITSDWKNIYTMLFNVLKKFPAYRLVIKEKASGPLNSLPVFIANQVNFDVNRIKIIRKINPIDLMQNASLVISTDSSMMLDALQLNKEVICIRVKRLDKYYKPKDNSLVKNKLVRVIYNKKQLEKELNSLLMKGGN